MPETEQNQPRPERTGPESADLERRLGYFFAQPGRLREALGHRSYAFEHPEEGLGQGERLEFLGDAVLQLSVTGLLHRRFPEADEGELTRLRAWLVNGERLAGLARSIGLGPHLLLGRGEQMTGGADKPSILSDSLEALLGAVFLDGGFEAAQGMVARLWDPFLEEAEGSLTVKDHKTRLQEVIQKKAKATPSYRVLDCAGPDHERLYRVEVGLKGEILGRGEGRSKKEAEQAAAQSALAFLSGREGEK